MNGNHSTFKRASFNIWMGIVQHRYDNIWTAIIQDVNGNHSRCVRLVSFHRSSSILQHLNGKIPFPLYNRQNFWFLPCIFVSLFRFAVFWRVSDFRKSNLSVFPTGCYTAFSSRLCTLEIRLPDWSIYSLTCKSSMLWSF